MAAAFAGGRHERLNSDPEMEQMIKARFTPAHSNPLKSLSNQPLAGALHHARANRQSYLFELSVLKVVQMNLEIILHLLQLWLGGGWSRCIA